MSLSVEMKLAGLEGVLQTLLQLPPEVVSKKGGPVKAALRKGALVILREEALNLARVTNALSADDDERQSTGLLAANLVATRGKAPFDGNGERYLVRVRRKSYKRKGKVVTTLQTAQLLEYGAEGHGQEPEPWIRPAFKSKAAEAIKTVERELVKGIDRIVKKLARQNQSRR